MYGTTADAVLLSVQARAQGRIDSVCESREHDSGVEKRARDSGCDGNQIALAAEDLDLWRTRHFRKIHGAADTMSPDSRIHLATRIATPPEYNIAMQGPTKASA